MVELLKVDVSTKWLVHMIHGHLSHLKQPGSASGGVGKMDGMSRLTVALPKDGRVGVRLLHSPAGVNQLRSGGLDGWCVTMKGVLLML